MGKIFRSRVYAVADSAIARSLIQTSDGGFLLAGDAFDGQSDNGVLLKTDDMGNQTFVKIYSHEFSSRLYGVVQLSDSSYVAAGLLFYSNMAGDESIWILKVDAEGNILSETTFGDPAEQNDAYAIANTSDGGFIVTGLALNKSTENLSSWVLRFDQDCKVLWEKKFPGALAYSIRQTSDGGFILSGRQPIAESLDSKVYLLKISPDGDKIWDDTYETVYVPLQSDAIETPEHDFMAVEKQAVVKVDRAGNTIWKRRYNDSFFDTLALTGNGELAIVGSDLDHDSYDHAYLALLTGDGQNIINDNAEIMYPSGFTGVVLTAQNQIVASGYINKENNKSAMLLCVFK